MKNDSRLLQEINDDDIRELNNKSKSIWENISGIGNAAFFGKKELKYINIPSKIKIISKFSFSKSGIEKIKLNSGINIIEESAFNECKNLENIKLPNTITKIESKAFMNCKNLKNVTLSRKLESIGEDAFYGCENLKKIVIPRNVKKISRSAFCNSGIVNIKLKNKVEIIGEYAFSYCRNLNNIILPSNIRKIECGAFSNSALKTIYLNNKLRIIEEDAFFNCKSLEFIKMPNSVEALGARTFKSSSLKEVTLSEKLNYIPEECFYECNELKSCYIHSNIKSLKNLCFANSGLEEITIDDGIWQVGEEAFLNCYNLNQIEIPNSVTSIGKNAFKGCSFKYIYKLYNGKWILSVNSLNRSGISKCYDISKIGDMYSQILALKDSEKILDRLVILKKNNIYITNECYENEKFMENIFYNDNLDFVKKLFKRLKIQEVNEKYILPFYKLLYNLGAFSDDLVARQRACNFIENLFDKSLINFNSIYKEIEKINIDSYNAKWAEFIMENNNFLELLKLEKEGRDELIANTCNRFEQLRDFCRSNKGSQRYLKPTLDKALECFAEIPFDGVDENTKDISIELSKFTSKQEIFDEAKDIREKYLLLKKENKVKDDILDESIYEEIDEERKNILKDSGKIMESLSNVAEEKFTYEFLSKYDPRNFVIGKYCSCCANLDGVGKGIVYASVLHPDCQNIVIKDSKGKIVAKAILYVNRKQGYGVLNTIEVNTNIDEENKNIIYKKIKKGITAFASKYNELNEIKLKQVNVGMDFNALKMQIRKNDEPGSILKAIDFSDYTYPYHSHIGDWQDEQYVIWKK